MRSIQNKLFFYLFSLAIIPLLIVGLFSYSIYAKALKVKLILNIDNNMDQITKNIDWKVKNVQKYMNLIITDERILDILSQENIDFAKGGSYHLVGELNKFFYSCFYGDNDIKYSGLFSDKGGYFFYNAGVLVNESLVRKSKWYLDIIAGNGQIVWVGNVHDPNLLSKEKDYFIIGRRIYNSASNGFDPLGVFTILLKKDFFTDIFGDIDEIPDAQAAIIGIDGKIILQRGNKDFENLTNDSFFQRVLKEMNGQLFTELNGRQVAVAFSTSKLTGWKIVKIIPSSYLVGEIQSISYLTLLALVGSAVVFYIASFIISRGISKPIKRLAVAMKRFGKKDFEVSVPVLSKDEIGMISQGFNTMVKEISNLFELAINEERLKRKAQIRALQYQINPHFIYNTLSGIRLIASGAGDFKAADMLKTLIRLLRNTISKADSYSTVEEEINNINDYIYLQKIQYVNRLRVDYDINDDILTCIMPGMLLQPVIENSIIHGLNDKLNQENAEAIITIKGYQYENDMYFELWDNGVGIYEEKISGIFAENITTHINPVHIGIRNIHDRLLYEFGKGYGIQIESAVNQYTLVKLRLPLIKKMRKDETIC